MVAITIQVNGDGAWQDLEDREIIHITNESPIQVAVLDGGLVSGRPSVGIRLDLPDDRVVVAETTARLFCSAARAIMARYPNLFED